MYSIAFKFVTSLSSIFHLFRNPLNLFHKCFGCTRERMHARTLARDAERVSHGHGHGHTVYTNAVINSWSGGHIDIDSTSIKSPTNRRQIHRLLPVEHSQWKECIRSYICVCVCVCGCKSGDQPRRVKIKISQNQQNVYFATHTATHPTARRSTPILARLDIETKFRIR